MKLDPLERAALKGMGILLAAIVLLAITGQL